MGKNVMTVYAWHMVFKFLFDAVYKNPVAKSEESKVFGIVEGLFKYFDKYPVHLIVPIFFQTNNLFIFPAE